MKKVLFATAVVMLGLAGLGRAADEAPATEPTTMPASAPAIISAGDKDALTAAVDKTATVEGTISDAAWSSSGKVLVVKFKDADDSSFTAVVFSKNKEAMEKAFGGDLTEVLKGAKVRVRGKVASFREHPEIIVDRPDQMQVLDKPAEKAAG